MLKKTLMVGAVILFASILLFVGCAKKEAEVEKQHIIVATDATWPPMEMVDESKNIVGFDIDLLNAAAEACAPRHSRPSVPGRGHRGPHGRTRRAARRGQKPRRGSEGRRGSR